MVTSDLPALADAMARWVDGVPGVPAVYLFGSRVRGDHRPGSDVDLCIFLWEWAGHDTTTWWVRQNRENFAELKALLPGPPKLHLDDHDGALAWVRAARTDPDRIVLQVRRAVCLWLPSKPRRDDADT